MYTHIQIKHFTIVVERRPRVDFALPSHSNSTSAKDMSHRARAAFPQTLKQCLIARELFLDAAKICGHVALAFYGVNGPHKRSSAIAATQGVSNMASCRRGLRHLSLAATSAFDATKRRQISRWPLTADRCSGVARLQQSKAIKN